MIHSYILPYEHVKRFKNDPGYQVIEHGNEATATNANLLLNHANQYLKHKKVRQAIAMALDKDQIADAAMFGASKAAHAHIGSGVSWVHFPEYDYKQDIAKSNQILDAAGFKRGSDGTRFSLRDYWSSGRAFEGRAAQVVRSQLRKVGIDIKISSFDKPSFLEHFFTERRFIKRRDFYVDPYLT
jgi:peptide/nickel transport system substrate-binding protein